MVANVELHRVELQRHVALVGMMASGKTTMGTALAAALGVAYVDNDATIASILDESGRELVERAGVDALHAFEAEMLLQQLDLDVPCVIAAAASVVDSPDCRAALARRATVVWLDIPAGEIVRRLGHGSHRRRIGATEIGRLHAMRSAGYAAVADLRLRALDPLEARVERVVDHLRERGSGHHP